MKKKVEVPKDDGTVTDLLRELSVLRARVDESTAQFGMTVKARIDEIAHALSREGAPGAGHVLPEPRLVKKMVRRLKAQESRAVRGRAKDLKKIQDLVAYLTEAVASRE